MRKILYVQILFYHQQVFLLCCVRRKNNAFFFNRSHLVVTNGMVYDVKIILRVICLITASEFHCFVVLKSFKNSQMKWSTDFFTLMSMQHIKIACLENVRLISYKNTYTSLIEMEKTKPTKERMKGWKNAQQKSVTA